MGALYGHRQPPVHDHGHFDLPAGRMMRLQRARGWTLHCEFGEVLLTQQGDGRDHVLKAGGRMAIETRGRVLAEAAASRNGARFSLIRPRGFFPLSRPVVRLVSLRAARCLPAPEGAVFACSSLACLSREAVCRKPRPVEALLRGILQLLRLRLPSLQESFAAAVFLRSKSWH